MLAAAWRGIEISLIFDSPGAGKTAFTVVKAVGEELEALSNIYIWPFDKRPGDAAGRYGSLHAKCAVVDEAHGIYSEPEHEARITGAWG